MKRTMRLVFLALAIGSVPTACSTIAQVPTPPASRPAPTQIPATVNYRVTTFTAAAHQLDGDEVFCVLFAKDGRMWVGTDQGISILDKGSWSQMPLEKGVNGAVLSLHEFNDAVWAGTMHSLWKITPTGKQPILGQGLLGMAVRDMAHFNDELWVQAYNVVYRVQNDKPEALLKLPMHGILPKVSVTSLLPDGKTLWAGAHSWPDAPPRSDGPVWSFPSDKGNPPLFHFQDNRWIAIGKDQGLDVEYSIPRYLDPDKTLWLDTDKGPLLYKAGAIKPALPDLPPVNEKQQKIRTLQMKIEQTGEDSLTVAEKAFITRYARLCGVIPVGTQPELVAAPPHLLKEAAMIFYSSLNADDREFYDAEVFPTLMDESLDRWARSPDGTLGILTRAHFFECRRGDFTLARLVDEKGRESNPFQFRPWLTDLFKEGVEVLFCESPSDGVYWFGTREHGLIRICR
jgi:hypothetical protein